MESMIRGRLEEFRAAAPDSIGAMMDYVLLSCDAEAGEYVFRCKTYPWMRNLTGTLHGGICATVLDQAMGFVAYCIKPGEGIAPTIQMQVSYHRALLPGEDVVVKVWVVSVTRSLMSFRGEAFQASEPDRLCLSGSATYFYKAMSGGSGGSDSPK